MLRRRGFLLLLGAAAAGAGAGLWLPETGLVQLPRRFALELKGNCSFCGKAVYKVDSLLGVRGRSPRICNECIGLCLDILAESDIHLPPQPPPALPAGKPVTLSAGLEWALEQLSMTNAELMATLQGELVVSNPPAARPQRLTLHCSFCDAPQKEVRKLIAGPVVYICDVCTGDAASIAGACS